jgi:hypothetical protein
MSTRCPTCSRPLGGDSYPDRILAMLAESDRPLMPAEISNHLGAQRTTIYQTLRRLTDRGSIRRAVVQGMTGYIIVPQQVGTTPHAEVDPAELADAKAEMQATMTDLAAYVSGVGRVSRERAIEYLARMGYPEALAQDIIGLTITADVVAIDGDSLVPGAS